MKRHQNKYSVSQLAQKRNFRKKLVRKIGPIFLAAIASLFPWHGQDVRADLVKNGSTWEVTSASPNPWTDVIGQGRNTPLNQPTILTIDSGAAISVVNKNAISVGDSITIDVFGTVTGNSSSGSGIYGTGPNVVEGNSNMTINIAVGGVIEQTGTTSNGEAINLHGFGNQIINHGTIRTVHNAAAIWFQDSTSSGGDPSKRNAVFNYGTIEQDQNKNVIGTSAGNGIVFHNKSGGTVIGNLVFSKGNDDLYFEAGSSITGNIDGGGGTNALYLEGDSSLGTGTLSGAVKNFQSLTKIGTSTWEITGSLEGFKTTTVDEGILRLSADNSKYTGTLTINPNGTLETRPQSLPTNNPSTGNMNNVINNGVLRFIENQTGTYIGQIVGSGSVEMTGSGVVVLSPVAASGNTYTGGTWIKSGTIAVTKTEVLGTGDIKMGSGDVAATNGTLRLDGDNIDLTENIGLLVGGGTINTNGHNGNVSGLISGTAGFTKAGPGTLTLLNENSYTGGTTISGGELQFGDSGTSGRIYADGTVNITDSAAALVVNHSDNYTVSGLVSGSGKVVQRGTGTTTLTNTGNSFTGGTEIEAGQILIFDANSYNKTSGSANNAGHIAYTGADVQKTATVGSGIGSLTNHIRTETGTKNEFNTTDSLTIMNVNNNSPDHAGGGAFYVASGTSLNVNLGGDLSMNNNKAGGAANDISIATGGVMNMNIALGNTASSLSGLNGSGTLNLTNHGTFLLNASGDSRMGTTNVQAGTFHLANNGFYLNSDSFNVYAGASLVGTGFIEGDNSVLLAGTVSPGEVDREVGKLAFPGSSQITIANTFQYNYDAVTPNSTQQNQADVTEAEKNSRNTANDLIQFGGQTVTIAAPTNGNWATVDLKTAYNPITNKMSKLQNGRYLLFDSDGATFQNANGTALTNTDLNTLFDTKLNGESISVDSPRWDFAYYFDNQAGQSANTQIWLDLGQNSLTMDWIGTSSDPDNPVGGAWVYHQDRMKSLQSNLADDGTTHYEYQFADGDKVHISTADSGSALNIRMNWYENIPESPATNVIVSGLVIGRKADGTTTPLNQGDITILGSGGITADKNSAYGVYVEGYETPILLATGKLEKFGDGNFILSNTGVNDFFEGIDIYNGTINIASTAQDRLGIYAGASNGGLITFKNGNVGVIDSETKTLSVSNFVQKLQNRFVVEADVTDANIAAYQDTTLLSRGVNSSITLDDRSTLNLHNSGHIVSPNPLVVLPYGLFIQGNVEGSASSTINVLNSSLGSGFTQIEKNSGFSGTTNIGTDTQVGKLRVLKNVVYGSSSNTAFNLNSLGVLEGGGTIQTTQAVIGGHVSPDNATFTPDKKTIATVERQGVLTFKGDGTTASSLVFNSTYVNPTTREGFVFDYRAVAPNTVGNANPTDTPNDLIAVRGMNTITLNGGIINFLDSTPVTGNYLIIDSDIRILDQNGQQFREDGGATTYLDGINNRPDGVLWGQVNGSDIVSGGPRGDFEFDFNDADGASTDGKQIWLHVDHNTLQMVWQGGNGLWTSDRWLSKQDESGVHDDTFFDGDLVYFNDDHSTNYSVSLNHDVIVSGMDVDMTDASSLVTISGTGGVTAIQTDPSNTYIHGEYANTANPQNFATTGKLVKSGDGTLKFANTGTNLFNEGIDINAGTLSFNNGKQLQVASGKAITFVGNGTLRADSEAKLETDIVVNADLTGTLEAGQDIVMILDGTVSGPGNITKNGEGTVQINSNNLTALNATNVDNGTLRLLDGKVYQTNSLQVNSAPTKTGTLAGAGTFATTNSVTISGKISPDKFLDAVDADGKATDRTGEKYATLTIDGGASAISTLNGFIFDYDAKTPNTETDPVADTENDLLSLLNMNTITLVSGTINIKPDDNHLATGKYLIVNADTNITVNGSTQDNDGLRDKLSGQIDGNGFENLSVRTLYSFRFNDLTESNESKTLYSQIWLDAELNTLQMNLTGAGGSFVWNTTSADWNSQQVSNNAVHETVFRNGDFAYLGNGSTADDMEIELDDNIVVSGLNVGKDSAGADFNGNVTISGNYGITSIKQNEPGETYIIGRYAKTTGVPVPADQEFLTTGKLEKCGSGTLTFENTEANLFSEGIDIYIGTISFSAPEQLSVRIGQAITFKGSESDHATLRPNATTNLNTAIVVDDAKFGTLKTGTGINLFVNNDVSGMGTLNKTGSGAVQLSSDRDRAFSGTTNVKEGSFRVTGEKIFGGSANAAFIIQGASAGSPAALEGNGTIRTNDFQANANSVISPDSKDLNDPTAGNEIGKLLVQGTDSATSTALLDGFTMRYDVVAPNTSNDPSQTQNDLFRFIDMSSVTIDSGAINFVGSLASGEYLVIDSNVEVNTNGREIDGIERGGVLEGYLNGTKIVNNSPRGGYEFVLKDRDDINSQVWLVSEHNTLTMNRSNGGNWFDTNWKSTQYEPAADPNPPTDEAGYAHSFENGDYVKLSSDSGNDFELNLDQSVLTSGMEVNSNGSITIGGTDGIRATSDLNNPNIEGVYINDPSWGDREVVPTGKLVKTGSGDLVFRNIGLNDFEDGIELGGGTTAFNSTAQLGNRLDMNTKEYVGNKITFTDNATLRADDSVSTYNETNIADGKTATFESLNEEEWNFYGILNGNDTTTLKKTGSGTLSLYNHRGQVGASPFAGSVDVSEGTLGVYGNYGNTHGFEVQNNATLSGTGTIGALTNGGMIKSGGTLAPGGLSTYTDPSVAPVENPLTVVGNLSFEAGSNFDVRITQFDDGGEKLTPYSDQVTVTGGGTVSIAEGAKLNVELDFWGGSLSVNDFNAEQSDHFTIIDANDGEVENSAAQFLLNLSNNLPRGVVMQQGWNSDSGKEFQLWFEDNGGFEDLCPRHNRNEIGKTLDQLVWNRDSGMRDLIDHLSDPSLSDKEVCDILDQLTGDLTPNAMMMALKKPWRHPFNRLSLEPDACSPCGALRVPYKRELWGEFYGSYTDVRFDGNAHPFTVNRYGVVVGMDQRLSKRSVVGIAFNYADPRLRQDTGKVEMDDYEIGLYGMTKLRKDYLVKWYAGYSHQCYDFDRRVYIPGTEKFASLYERYKSKTDGDAFSASIEFIKAIRFRSNVLLLPTIAFDFEQAWMKGYSEKGGLTALQYDNSTLERMMLRFGIGAEYALRRNLDLKARIQYATQLNDVEYPRVGVRFVNASSTDQRHADIWGSRIGRDYLNLGIGMDWQLNAKRTTKLYINYDADLYNRATVHAGEVGLVRQW